MDFLFKNNGKACAAKTVFMIAFFTCLAKILFAGVNLGWFVMAEPDYAGMATFLTPLAALYWGRSSTKANS